MHQGIFIAIESSRDDGKNTQLKLLAQRLSTAGYRVEIINFPRHEAEASHFSRRFIEGGFGKADELGPYIPSLFEALDRFDAHKQIEKWLHEGKIVLTEGYSMASKANYGQNIPRLDNRKTYYEWLDQLEYGMLGTSQPHLTILLGNESNAETSKFNAKAKLAPFRRSKKVGSSDISYLYRELAKLYPSTCAYIDCSKNGDSIGVPTVNNLIWDKLEPLLKSLDKEIANDSKSTKIDKPSDLQLTSEPPDSILQEKLANHLKLVSSARNKITEIVGPNNSVPILELLEPVSIHSAEKDQPSDIESKLLKDYGLQPLKGNGDKAVSVLDYWPRNELDAIALTLYPHSTLPHKELFEQVSRWGYEEKVNALTSLLKVADTTHMRYHLEFLTSYRLFKLLNEAGIYTRQALTPLYGYDHQEILEDTEAESLYEDCFDSSMELFQAFEAADRQESAENFCLQGHKLRWQLNVDLAGLKKILGYLKEDATTEAKQVYGSVLEAIDEVHPLLVATISQMK